MATNFTLADAKTVSIKGAWQTVSGLAAGEPYYLVLHAANGSKDILATFVRPTFLGSPFNIYNDVFWATIVLPAGDYTIANDAGCTKLSFGEGGYSGNAPLDFLVSA